MLNIIDNLKNKIKDVYVPEEFHHKLNTIPNQMNELGFDNWGMNLETIQLSLRPMKWLFEDYFRTEVYGIENVPPKRVLLIPNHSGQLPLDGMMIYYAMIKYAKPPRIVRAMVERFVPRLPFVSTYFARCGQVVGTPINCKNLLENEEAVMVFPEGAKGSGKLFWKRYRLQKFGTGFMRLALETRTPIIPIAVIGAEETYPSMYNFKTAAKLMKAPYFPITPFFPFFGPLGAIPLPAKIRIYFGEPMIFDGDFDEPEYEIQTKVDHVASCIQKMIHKGLRERKGIFR